MKNTDPDDADAPLPSREEVAASAFSFALESEVDYAPGSQIENYKLLQKLGEGGFGVVWMAEQQQPIRRRVAVKIIKIGMDTDEVIARFEVERQALALMEHPNIARVFDAGTTQGGRPFFVMELVRGVAITRYCDENRLSAEARLKLFITLCQAVQHAHQKGVIHRDLKPSNILVTLHDGVPVPKIIDFGIAKATGTRLTDKTLFTQFHAFIGTPAYTSPEQMEMSGLDIDTRSDIYSLGVLLYELLTGRPPFDPDALAKSGLEAMRRTIREVDPPRPSHRLKTLTEADRSSVAQQRSTDQAKLSFLLRGDLDWVVMRCLEKDRTRRYDTAATLAQDVQRHLANEPVLACPPSRIYQTRKFIHRHKIGVAAGTAVALSLIGGLLVSSTLFVRERLAHSRAVVAEKQQNELRQQADLSRHEEVKRAARTALALANRNLADGRVADGLAYLVYAARKDPLNPTLAPRIASTLASHNFLLPESAPFDCGSQVMALRYSADGRTFFVGTADGTLRRFESATGKLIHEFHLGQAVKLFGGWQFARANDAVFAARFQDGSLIVFDADTGRPRTAPIPLSKDVITDPAVPDNAGLSPDGRWIYACGQSRFWLWDAATGENRITLPIQNNECFCDFSNDGRRLVVSGNGAARLWSLPDCVPVGDPLVINVTSSNRGPSLFVRFSPDSHRLAVMEWRTAIHLFDSATGARVKPAMAYDEYVYPTLWDFTPDGRLLVIGANTCRLWDLDTGRVTMLPLASRGYFEEHAFNRDGATLLTTTADGYARLWDTKTGALLAEPVMHQNSQFVAAVSPGGGGILIGTASGLVYRVRHAQNVAQPLVLPRTKPGLPAPFLPGTPTRLLWFARDHAHVLDVGTGRRVAGGFDYPKTITTPLPGLGSSHSPLRDDLKFMVVRDDSGTWQAWELAPTKVRRVVTLQNAPEEGKQVVFSPVADQVAIIAGSTIRMWNLHTGEEVGPAIDCGQLIIPASVNFSPDGRRVGVGGERGLAAVWEVETGRRLTSFGPFPDSLISAVRFSPNGGRIVTFDRAGQARLWDAASSTPLSPILYHTDSAQGAVFSPDGRRFATWTYAELRLWDGETGAAVVPPIMHVSPRHVYFNSDGTRLLEASDVGDARLWDVSTGQPISEPMRHGAVSLPLAAFSPDEHYLRTETTKFDFCVWSVPPAPPPGAPVPEWLLQLATLCATKIVDETGQLADAPEAIAKIDALRSEIVALPADSPYAEWGRWILNDRADRSIAPGFTLTPAEAEKLTVGRAAPAGILKP